MPGALCTDQYELTMAQAYLAAGIEREPATFSLYVRTLPPERNFLLAAGLRDVLGWLERWSFDEGDLAYLRSLDTFSEPFLRWLAGQRFEGDVRAMPEGTPFFANEPILEIDAPLAQAQLVETFVLNQIHSQTVLASKAARVVEAAAGRAVVDFGMRRTHGIDGARKAARAFYVAGVGSTSNLDAGAAYALPVAGTMAHSFVEAFDTELDAFRAFVREFPHTVLLVDTYDTLQGVAHVVRLAHELGDDFRVRGVRLDSGDVGALASEARRMLDEAGLHAVRIFASGGLDELAIRRLVQEGRPIDGFGVGTAMGVSDDAPKLDMAYKLVEHRGVGRMKLSAHKRTLPGRKQVFRLTGERDRHARDVIALADDAIRGRALLRTVMSRGSRTPAGDETLEDARRRAREEVARLPDHVRMLEPADPPYGISLSRRLHAYADTVARELARVA